MDLHLALSTILACSPFRAFGAPRRPHGPPQEGPGGGGGEGRREAATTRKESDPEVRPVLRRERQHERRKAL
eukprot:416580-Pyramimonas_sp.AAC.1